MKPPLVPYVAMWSSEQEALKAVAGIDLLDDKCPRDSNGVFWMPFGDSPGVGTPLFGEVHPKRQAACMRKPLCQVCGKKLDRKRTHWILNKLDAEALTVGKPFATQTPPVCEKCIPVSLHNCPHLSALGESVKILEVTRYSCVGIYGDLVMPFGSIRRALITYGNPLLLFMIGRQVIVELRDYKTINPREFLHERETTNYPAKTAGHPGLRPKGLDERAG